MPKRKTVEKPAIETAAAAADLKKRSRSAATKPNTPAATHKRATKKIAIEVSEPQVYVPTHDDIARLAYSYWEARGHAHGSPSEDWIRAEQELLKLAQHS
jgi:hypothetical protein